LNAAAIAAAVMFGAFVIELAVSRLWRRDRHHDLRDTAVNLVIGGGYVISAGLASLVTATTYLLVWNATPLRWDESSPLYWVLLLLGEDCLYYWSHRASHVIPVMWASHVVHHNSPKLNLSTGMRNSWFGGWLDWVFMLPLVALGCHPISIAIVQAIATASDFLAHTPYFPKSRVLDWIFNSPSNHRVHHGANPEYVDKNFGGFLIIWDRLFGTYQAEAAPVRYGTEPMPERPYNPLHLETYLWRKLIARSHTSSTATASRSEVGSQSEGIPPTASWRA
jgi:sterol desaturase/sphingolipid hydroxylase (fatty acid hydroxylase superfamily)